MTLERGVSYDPALPRFRARIAIDTDLATTAALWMEPNRLQLSFLVLNSRGTTNLS